jgi:uncharacterized protein
MKKSTRTNRLAHETSPYLLQHASNPVDWFPWGEEALRKAKKENKPIFLSIGYSACHWCHVMEKESFEEEATAKILNEHFVSIKVDREERPDLDNIYMNAVQIMTHRGGWPMTVFLTPELLPFYGGTYFPPEDKMGMPSFKKLLLGVANTWKNREGEVKKSAGELLTAIKEVTAVESAQESTLSFRALTEAAFHRMKNSFDPTYGGLGKAPKFFHTGDFRLALRHWQTTQSEEALTIVNSTLELWSRGGIYDQLGGGFHRYSTDDQWLVPHFEKMLYDNALLAEVYLEAFQATRHLPFAKIAREILDYVLKEMTSPEGIFFSTEDADSEGVEGKFYLWLEKEIDEALSPDIAPIFKTVYNVSPEGNWEHHNILHRTESWQELALKFNLSESELEDTLAVAKRKLFALRQKRVRPGIDTKSLTSWNAMFIHSLALAHQVLNEPTYLVAAEKAASFLLKNLWDGKNLKHIYAQGEAKFNAFLEDYAYLTQALLTLYESNFDEAILNQASEVGTRMVQLFWEGSLKQFFFAEANQKDLLIRPVDSYDGAVPSSTGMAITALIRLGMLTAREDWIETSEKALMTYESQMRTLPQASSQMLLALQLLQNRAQEFVLIPGADESYEDWLQVIRENFLPNKVITVKRSPSDRGALFAGKDSIENKTTLYICENRTCEAPIHSIEELKRRLKKTL